MRKTFCAKKISRTGFTLIEILIVVAIIAILASIVLVGIGPTEQLGRDARRVSDLHSIQTALELYYAQNGRYPKTITSADLTPALIGGNAVPQDPTNNAAAGYVYGYGVSTDQQSYLLWAKLENKSGSSFQGYTPPSTTAPDGSTYSNTPTGGSCAAPYYCLTL